MLSVWLAVIHVNLWKQFLTRSVINFAIRIRILRCYIFAFFVLVVRLTVRCIHSEKSWGISNAHIPEEFKYSTIQKDYWHWNPHLHAKGRNDKIRVTYADQKEKLSIFRSRNVVKYDIHHVRCQYVRCQIRYSSLQYWREDKRVSQNIWRISVELVRKAVSKKLFALWIAKLHKEKGSQEKLGINI